MKIGVLALQGDFQEHIKMLELLNVKTVEVRLPEDLESPEEPQKDPLDALIIPGGESTTMGKLILQYNLKEPLRKFAAAKPVWGTCCGMILLAKDVGIDQPLLSVMDITVERNAFGSQIDSFQIDLDLPLLRDVESKPFPAVFIRAPKLVSFGKNVKVIARLPDGTPVAAQQEKCLVTAFHPELTEDTRFHRYFIELICS